MSYPVKDIEHAFPTVFPCEEYGSGYRGLSMRDYFAAAAMQGMVGNSAIIDTFSAHALLAEESYKLADEMILARKEIAP